MPFSRVARVSDKSIHNYVYIFYFVYGTTLCRKQNKGSPGKNDSLCFKCDYDRYKGLSVIVEVSSVNMTITVLLHNVGITLLCL